MNRTFAIARKEFRTFFNSPVAYIVIGLYLLIAGYLFFSTLFAAGQASLRAFFSIAPMLFVVFAPALTMRLIAEERKTGTVEFLLTQPLQDWEVVVGKFLASLATVGVGLLFSLPFALSVASLTSDGQHFDWGSTFAGYLGLTLLASSFLSLGLFASCLSKNQIVGLIAGFSLCLAFYLVDKLAVFFPDSMGGVLQFLSVDFHFENIARGGIDSRDVIFYLSLTAAGLVLTTRSLAGVRQ